MTQVNASQALCTSGREDSNLRPPEPHSGGLSQKSGLTSCCHPLCSIPHFTPIESFQQGFRAVCYKAATRMPCPPYRPSRPGWPERGAAPSFRLSTMPNTKTKCRSPKPWPTYSDQPADQEATPSPEIRPLESSREETTGKETVLQNRLPWARWELQRDGVIETTRRGHFRLL